MPTRCFNPSRFGRWDVLYSFHSNCPLNINNWIGTSQQWFVLDKNKPPVSRRKEVLKKDNKRLYDHFRNTKCTGMCLPRWSFESSPTGLHQMANRGNVKIKKSVQNLPRGESPFPRIFFFFPPQSHDLHSFIPTICHCHVSERRHRKEHGRKETKALSMSYTVLVSVASYCFENFFFWEPSSYFLYVSVAIIGVKVR